jgi:SAM-dependent methyltransferase
MLDQGWPPEPINLDVPATWENFHEDAYLTANPDVTRAVQDGLFGSGRQHFEMHGHGEGRYLRLSHEIEPLRAAKIDRIHSLLRLDLPHRRCGLKYDFLTDQLRTEAGISDTENVSGHSYYEELTSLIENAEIILDCGAGRRPVYYGNVVNYEIVDYDTTDIIGVGEALPFRDNVFDGVISIAVLEHVRDPFRCANEIARVLKPGGRLICAVPFLQPLHAYPHHYYNMTYMGARALFDRTLVIDEIPIGPSQLPVNSLAWIARSWAAGLTGEVREAFLDMRLRELTKPVAELLDREWVTALSREKNLELADSTYIRAHKPTTLKGNGTERYRRAWARWFAKD